MRTSSRIVPLAPVAPLQPEVRTPPDPRLAFKRNGLYRPSHSRGSSLTNRVLSGAGANKSSHKRPPVPRSRSNRSVPGAAGPGILAKGGSNRSLNGSLTQSFGAAQVEAAVDDGTSVSARPSVDVGPARGAIVSWGQNSVRSIRTDGGIGASPATSRRSSYNSYVKWQEAHRAPNRRESGGYKSQGSSASGETSLPFTSPYTTPRMAGGSSGPPTTPSVLWPADSPFGDGAAHGVGFKPAAASGSMKVGLGHAPPTGSFVLGGDVVASRRADKSEGVHGYSRGKGVGCASMFACTSAASCGYDELVPPGDYHRFQELQSWLQSPFDEQDDHHKEKLKVLFDAAFHGKPYSSATDEHWKKMGFQGKPSRDFRAGGVAALDVMVFIAHNYFPLFKVIMNEGNDYGFALVTINLVHIIKQHLRLVPLSDGDLRLMTGGHTGGPCSKRVMKHFAHAFASYSFFFHEIVTVCVEAAHRGWMKLKASNDSLTVMSFNTAVLDDVPAALNKAFRQPVLTVAQFKATFLKAKGLN